MLSALPGQAVPALRLGYVLRRGGLGGGPELLLTRRSLLLSATFGAQLPFWRVLGTRLEVGLCGGALFRSSASGATVGPYLQLAHPTGRGFDVTARFEFLTLYPWAGDRPSSVLLFSIGVESHGRGAGDLMDQERR